MKLMAEKMDMLKFVTLGLNLETLLTLVAGNHIMFSRPRTEIFLFSGWTRPQMLFD